MRYTSSQPRHERVIHYGRVSSHQQAAQYGLKTQLDACRALSQQMGWEIVAEYCDTISGAKMTREGLDRLREDIREGRATAVVAYHMDRINRDPAHHYLFIAEMKQADARVYYASKGGRAVAGTDDDEFLEDIEALVAFRERNRIQSRTLDARRRKALDGALMGNGETPIGYKRVGERGNYHWEIVEEEAKLVRRIYELFLGGTGVFAIANQLTKTATPTPSDMRNLKKGNRKAKYGHWNTTTIYKILRNEAYSGVGHTFRQVLRGESKTGGKSFGIRPPSEWYNFTCPVIIPPEQWHKVQAKLDEGKVQSPRNSRYEYLVARRIRCGECRRAIQGKPTWQGRYRYYTCSGRRDEPKNVNPDCSLPVVRVEALDEAVWAWVVGVLLNEATLRERSTENTEANTQARSRIEDRRLEVAAVLSNLALKNKRLRKFLLDERITEAEYDEERDELAQQQESLKKELDSLTDKLRILDGPGTLEENIKLAALCHARAENADFGTKRGIIENLQVGVTLAVEDGKLVAEFLSSAFQIRDRVEIPLPNPK